MRMPNNVEEERYVFGFPLLQKQTTSSASVGKVKSLEALMNKGSGLTHLDKNLLQVKNHELLHWVAMLAFIYPLHVNMYVKLSKVGVLMIGSHLFTGNIK